MLFKTTQFGLYRDDRLAAVKSLSGPIIERLKKTVVKHSRIVD